jgi:hypothetical protein
MIMASSFLFWDLYWEKVEELSNNPNSKTIKVFKYCMVVELYKLCLNINNIIDLYTSKVYNVNVQ